MRSIDYWYEEIVLGRKNAVAQITTALKQEVPNLISSVWERACNLQCAHCIYPADRSSEKYSDESNFSGVLRNIVQQMPTASDGPRHQPPFLLHEGRILRSWHIPVLAHMRSLRADLHIGLIDNGSYVSFVEEFKKHDFLFDWLDISIDGLKENHNRQRDPIRKQSFDQTFNGIRHGRSILKPNGRLSSLMTITNLNYTDILPLAESLLSQNLVDQAHFTFMSSKREPNFAIEMKLAEWRIAWNQLKEAYQKYPDKIVIKFFRIEDLDMLAQVIGTSKVFQRLQDKKTMRASIGVLIFDIEGVEVHFYPVSLWPQESIVIDADSAYRTAYMQQYTIEQLRKDPDKQKFTVCQLTAQSDFIESYHRCVDHWWTHFGKDILEKERAVFEKGRLMATTNSESQILVDKEHQVVA